MASEYYKILSKYNFDIDVIGRGLKSAEVFYKNFNKKVLLCTIDDYFSKKLINTSYFAIVSTSIESLYDVTVSLLNNNIQFILLEKPGSLYFDQIEKLAYLAKHLNSKLYIAYNRRYFPSVGKLMENLKFEKLLSCHFEFNEFAHKINELDLSFEVKQRWLIANSSHIFDLVFYIIGRPKELTLHKNIVSNWHKSNIYTGSGVSDKTIFFSFHSNWVSPGRWLIDIRTDKNRYILQPIEELHYHSFNSFNPIKVPFENNSTYKTGLEKMVLAFINQENLLLPTIHDHLLNFSIYEKFYQN